MSRRTLVATLVVLLCGVGVAHAQAPSGGQPVKVYIEAPDVMAASDALRAKCGNCTVVTKKEAADILLMISKTAGGAVRFRAFENAKGALIKDGEAASLEEAIGPACEAISAKAAEARSAEAKAATPANGGKARVYIYRYTQSSTSAMHPSVYCDEVHIADLEHGRYFIVEVDTGKHSFWANKKHGVIELNTEPGKDYYLRVEFGSAFRGSERMVMMTPEQGAPDVRKLKYLDADDIIDTKMVKPAEPIR